MNLHLTIEEEYIDVWTSIDSCTIAVDCIDIQEELRQWMKLVDIKQLKDEETWRFSTHGGGEDIGDDDDDDYSEYILTEKQSALFLLRFK